MCRHTAMYQLMYRGKTEGICSLPYKIGIPCGIPRVCKSLDKKWGLCGG